MVTVPGLSFAYPAANPAIRLLEFSPRDFGLLDMHTYTADLHAANTKGHLDWQLEYSFADTFGGGSGTGVSPSAVADLVQRMAKDGSPEWQRYRGDAKGTLYCRGWLADVGRKADSECAQGCQGACKAAWLRVMNGTGIAKTGA